MVSHIILNDHIRRIKEYGLPASPRGMSTVEVLDAHITVPVGEVAYRKGGNVAIGFMEGFQLIGGFFYRDLIAAVAGRADLSLFTSQSAYGPRVCYQMHGVIHRLVEDPVSRRAVVLVARDVDGPEDLPCTTSIQYLVRHGALHTVVSMRSSDAIWGLPYDIIQFSMLSMVVARVLNVKYAQLHISMGSGHLYDSHPGGTKFEPWGQFELPTIIDRVKPTMTGYTMWAQEAAVTFAAEVQRGSTSKYALQKVGVRVW